MHIERENIMPIIVTVGLGFAMAWAFMRVI
jgi:hypothetical protein